MGLADLLKNLEDSLLDFRCCFVVVQPHREVLDAVVPVLRRLGMRAPRDMEMVFMLATKRTLRMSLIAPDFEKLAHPAHANRVFGGPPLKFGWQVSHCTTERRPVNRRFCFRRDGAALAPPVAERRKGHMFLEKSWIKMRVLDASHKQSSRFMKEPRIGR